MKNHDKTETAFYNVVPYGNCLLQCQSLLCESEIIFSVMQRDTILFTQQDLIAISGLYLRIDYQKVLLNHILPKI